MHGPNFAQLFTFGLAASTAVNGLQAAQNVGVIRRVAGLGLIAYGAPASAAPVLSLDPFNWINQIVKSGQPITSTAAAETPEDCDDSGDADNAADDASDDADDASDDADDAADDASDDADDAADDASDDAADDADDAADDASDDADDTADDASDDADDAADDADDAADDASDDVSGYAW
ncbi:hypothetical protein N0V93_002835 [Gnomoniopsis smithogilvyi]|uniref:Uncharacterized protein n=1 Tax=Gnomoniopsis smithogilvyi TaxID=1191159 RepID=A0A9W8YZC7_9PEZI|nr:hypothetical protein N0V93_002835 [Gnomoniopsis smithogilvyi]